MVLSCGCMAIKLTWVIRITIFIRNASVTGADILDGPSKYIHLYAVYFIIFGLIR